MVTPEQDLLAYILPLLAIGFLSGLLLGDAFKETWVKK